jgi:hypothetical protein
VVAVAALIHARAATAPPDETDAALRAHLARARRRDEPIDLLVLRFEQATSEVAREIRDTLRVTDSTCLTSVADGRELHVMVDRGHLDRDALETRLSDLAGCRLDTGWARFPEDGYTLGVLVAQARAAIGAVAAEATHDVAPTAPELFARPVAAARANGASE